MLMRRLMWLGLSAVACKEDGGADDGKGDDTDTPVDTDTQTGPRIWEKVEPIVPFVDGDFGGSKFVWYMPDNPVAVVFGFHGTGGNGDGLVTAVEMTAVLNEMIARGVGFIAPTALRTQYTTWDDESDPDDNPDFQLHTAMRDEFINLGRFSEETPIFGLGFSAGAAYASYFGTAAREKDWPIKGIFLHNGAGGNGRYNDPPNLPVMFMCAVNDEAIDWQNCVDNHADHVGRGREGVWAPHEESILEPTRFVRTGSLTERQSKDVFNLAVDNGYFDDRGHRLFEASEIEAKVVEFTTTYDVYYPKPVTAVLNVVLAAHAINGEHAVAEAEFVLSHL